MSKFGWVFLNSAAAHLIAATEFGSPSALSTCKVCAVAGVNRNASIAIVPRTCLSCFMTIFSLCALWLSRRALYGPAPLFDRSHRQPLNKEALHEHETG